MVASRWGLTLGLRHDNFHDYSETDAGMFTGAANAKQPIAAADPLSGGTAYKRD